MSTEPTETKYIQKPSDTSLLAAQGTSNSCSLKQRAASYSGCYEQSLPARHRGAQGLCMPWRWSWECCRAVWRPLGPSAPQRSAWPGWWCHPTPGWAAACSAQSGAPGPPGLSVRWSSGPPLRRMCEPETTVPFHVVTQREKLGSCGISNSRICVHVCVTESWGERWRAAWVSWEKTESGMRSLKQNQPLWEVSLQW